MKELFLKLVEMSLSAGWLVLAVVGLRLILRRMPKNLFCLLWGLVALRLIFPFSVESVFSLIPSGGDTVTYHTPRFDVTQVETGVSFVDETVRAMIGEEFPVLRRPRFDLSQIAAVIWLVGIALFLLYGVVSYLRMRGRVAEALPVEEGVYRCETVDGPFILGIFRPRIYVPARMDEETFHYAILHERTHLRRLDHLVKPLAFVFLAVYWFHPLLWVAYALLCRDMEAACDQRVLRDMDDNERRGYASALLVCGVDRKSLAACPVAFGETNVKSRIKGVLSYKKPTLWILLVAIVLLGVIVVCFLTEPQEEMKAYKPVIYLYPEEETACSVELVLEGELTCTYPAYGEEGWQRFTAHPDGTLIFEDGGEYYCLYWEGELPPTADFSTGFCVKGSDTAAFLNEALLAQGLTPREANEFIIYWLPLMEDNPYNLISFDTAAYTKSAQLQVEPAPDTVIRVFMTWQAAEEYVAMTPQTFTTPQRNGFTLVEWGGSKVE